MRALATARPISWLAVRDFHQFLICPSFNVLCSGTHGNTGSPFILEENMLLITLKELLERIRTQFADKLESCDEEVSILIGLQDRNDAASFSVQAGEKFGSHPLAIYDHWRDLAVSHVLFIQLQKCGDAHGEMLVAALNGPVHGTPMHRNRAEPPCL